MVCLKFSGKDDYETNIQTFRERKGNAILFPRLWNANHPFETSPDTYTIQQCADGLFKHPPITSRRSRMDADQVYQFSPDG